MQLTAKQVINCLTVNIEKKRSTMILGAPGIGKSQIVAQVAEKLEMELIDIRLNLRESVDLRGLPLVDAKTGTTRWLPPAELPTKGKGILFLDEITSGIQLSLQAAAMGLVLEGKLGEYRLPRGWVCVAAGNRITDKAAAQRMSTALSNRFSHFEMVPSVDDWVSWAIKNDISEYLTGYVRFRPTNLHVMPTNNEHAFPTPRTYEFANDYVNIQDKETRYQLLSSVLGEGVAIELEGHMETSKNLPDMDEVMNSPHRADLPDSSQPSAMHAIAQALAHRVTTKTFKNALIYMNRLPKEHEMAFVMDAINRDRSLINTRSYTDWCEKNQDFVL